MDAIQKCLTVIYLQQSSTIDVFENPSYTFKRSSNVPTDTLMLSGLGPPGQQVGALVRVAFRPSDDATTFPFHIPSNAMASVELIKLSKLLEHTGHSELASRCLILGQNIRESIFKYGIIQDQEFGSVFAYEIDGFGNSYLMDVLF